MQEEKLEEDFDILPVIAFKNDIIESCDGNQIVICIGETGSGKTTQIPQFFLDEKRLGNKMMAVTQPRRIAAITIAERVSEERKTKIGSIVGYSVRFDDKTSSETKIKYMTDGILIRECLHDKTLSKYQVIMLDEAHERSLHTDILFGLIKTACSLRPELKLIVTSATLDSVKFGTYFNNCPILRVPGRIFPVDIYHSKTKQVMTVSGPANNSYVQATVDIVLRIHRKEEGGHILVFLTGQEEIERACQLIRTAVNSEPMQDRQLIVLPLYAALSSDAQSKIFKNPAHLLKQLGGGSQLLRKCVIATNIAETSITVPQVRFVVDAGFVKQKTYDANRGMESLVVVPISKISAQQRAGRAGRTGPGQCYRLYSSECFDNMGQETVPEIQRTNLANTVLYLKALHINDIVGFDFLDPPSEDQVVEALMLLHTLRAIDDCGLITALGVQMSNFPLEPNLSRALIASAPDNCDCLGEVAIIAAMLCVENVFYVPLRAKETKSSIVARDARVVLKGDSRLHGVHSLQARSGGEREDEECRRAEEAHSRFRHPYGDHLTYLVVFNAWQDAGYSQNWCEQQYISYRSMITAKKIWQHLQSSIEQAGLRSLAANGTQSSAVQSVEKRICNAITAGFFMNAAVKCANDSVFKYVPPSSVIDGDLSTARRRDLHMLHMHPSSVLSQLRPPEFVVFQDLVHSNKLFMKQVVRASKKCLQLHQKQWRFVSAGRLCGREDVPDFDTNAAVVKNSVVLGQTVVGVKRLRAELGNVCEKEQEDSIISAVATSSTEVISEAKLRFLARKANGKKDIS